MMKTENYQTQKLLPHAHTILYIDIYSFSKRIACCIIC